MAGVGIGSFTVTTFSGQTVTVDEQSSTTYYSGPAKSSASIVVDGARVAVLGTNNGTTVTATRVIVLTSGSFGAGRT